MASQVSNFLNYHLCMVLVSAVATADGNESLSRHLSAQAKLRLLTMSDEELRELARMMAQSPERQTDVYRGFKLRIAELKQTSPEWIEDLPQNVLADPSDSKREP